MLEKFLLSINSGFLFLFTIAVVYAGLSPVQNKFHLFEAPVPVFIGACGLVGVLYWFVEATNRAGNLKKYYPYLVGFGFLTSFSIQLVIAHALRSYGYTWDSNLIFEQAVKYATSGSIDASFAAYTANSPNNIALPAGLGVFFKTLRHFGIENFISAAILLNVLLMGTAQILTFLTVKLLYGRTLAAISMVFSFIFISLTMYVQIPYTDTLTIVFPILLLYLSLLFTKVKQLWLKMLFAGFLGSTAIIGYLLKPTVIIALMAILAVATMALLANSRRKRPMQSVRLAAACLAMLMSAAFVTQLAYSKAVDRLNIVPFPMAKSHDSSLPLVHFFSMGLKTTDYGNAVDYGGYDDQQARTVTKFLTQEERTDYSVDLAKQRLLEYGPIGYASFLAHKANWILSDSTFYAYGEGSNEKVVFTSQDRISTFLRGFMYIGGAWYVLFGNILQVFWMALLLLIASQLVLLVVVKESRNDLYILIPRLMIGGILLFLLMFEGRSRYIFLYVPIFIVTAMYTLQWFNDTKPHKP